MFSRSLKRRILEKGFIELVKELSSNFHEKIITLQLNTIMSLLLLRTPMKRKKLYLFVFCD